MDNVLVAREQRGKIINELITNKTDISLVCIKANVIGVNKNPYYAYLLVNYFFKRLKEKIVIEDYLFYDNTDGPYYLVNTKVPSLELKEICINLEESKLGRLIDLDVHTFKGQVSRNGLGYNPRKCLVCDNLAIVCMRTSKHSMQELEEKMNDIINSYLDDTVKMYVDKAITLQATLDPKFGLVTKYSQGSHSDMNFSLLMKAKDAIIDDLVKMFKFGLDYELLDAFKKARSLGLETEKKMYQVTSGVNAYKGLIFILGIVLVVLGYGIKNRRTDIFTLIQEIGKDLVLELGTDLNTFGGYAYKIYGFSGARGEVNKGLVNVYNAKEILKDFSDEALHKTLIYLIGNVEDTVLLKRSKTIEKYNYYKNLVASIKDYNLDLINKVTNECIQNNISFGGSADLLIATIFIRLIEEEFGIIYE
jgi:holo-ACP synthase CitX